MPVGTGSIKRAEKTAETVKTTAKPTAKPSAKPAEKKVNTKKQEEPKIYGIHDELPYYLL